MIRTRYSHERGHVSRAGGDAAACQECRTQQAHEFHRTSPPSPLPVGVRLAATWTPNGPSSSPQLQSTPDTPPPDPYSCSRRPIEPDRAGTWHQRSMRFSDACMDVLAGDSHGCGYGCWRTRFPPSQGEEVSAPPSPMRNAQRLRRATISRRTKPRSIPSQHLMATADE